MDGNTWRRYRLITERGQEPPFFLEPDNPDDWPDHFRSAGFSPLARYVSALNDDLSVADPRVPEATKRLNADAVQIRPIDLSRFEDELKAVHELSVEAFADNFLYTPITQQEFLSMYAPVRPHLRSQLILLAEKDSRLIGFMFGVPDVMQAKRGQPITTAIAKSMAVRPGRSGAGLGSVLMDSFQQEARSLGFTRVIHALMHEDNRSLKISARFGKPIRQYTLFIRELAR
jgi:GNAT superfamily N-acetyltransferase